MSKQSPPMLKTKKKVISFCMANSTEEEQIGATDNFIKIIERITRMRLENLVVLTIVLRELPKLSKKHKWIRFNFGTKKEWELRRIK